MQKKDSEKTENALRILKKEIVQSTKHINKACLKIR